MPESNVIEMVAASRTHKYQPGQIVVLRTTGEKVCILELKAGPTYIVRRPSVSKDGFINHEGNQLYEFELATIEEFGNAQVDEILLKEKIEKRLYDSRQESRNAERIDTSIN